MDCEYDAILRNDTAYIKQLLKYIQNRESTLNVNGINRFSDEGKSIAHYAASLGSDELFLELIRSNAVRFDLPEKESGFTPLHYLLYHGRLRLAASLLRQRPQTNITIKDNEKLTALDLFRKTLKYERAFCYNSEVMAINTGFTSDAKLTSKKISIFTLPESFSTRRIRIIDVAMSKNTIILVSDAESNNVFLVNAADQVKLIAVPEKIVRSLTSDKHTVLVAARGAVYTMGINDCGQLGYCCEAQNKPLKVSRIPSNIIGGCVSNVHSMLWSSSNRVFVFGKNLGQFGLNMSSNQLIIHPREIKLPDGSIVDMCTKQKMTIALIKNGSLDIWILKEGTIKKLYLKIERRITTSQFRLPHPVEISKIGIDTKEESNILFTVLSNGDILFYSLDDMKACRLQVKSDHFNDVQECSVHNQRICIISSNGKSYYGHILGPINAVEHLHWARLTRLYSNLIIIIADVVMDLQTQTETFIDRSFVNADGCEECAVVSKDYRVLVEKEQLSMHSEYFAVLLNEDNLWFKEYDIDKQPVIYLDGIKRNVLEIIIEFVRKCHLINVLRESGINNEKDLIDLLLDLLFFSDMYLLDNLKEQAERVLVEYVTVENCVSLLEFAAKYSCHILKKCVISYMIYNIDILISSRIICQISQNNLLHLEKMAVSKQNELMPVTRKAWFAHVKNSRTFSSPSLFPRYRDNFQYLFNTRTNKVKWREKCRKSEVFIEEASSFPWATNNNETVNFRDIINDENKSASVINGAHGVNSKAEFYFKGKSLWKPLSLSNRIHIPHSTEALEKQIRCSPWKTVRDDVEAITAIQSAEKQPKITKTPEISKTIQAIQREETMIDLIKTTYTLHSTIESGEFYRVYVVSK
jgi:hypothetical protein